MDKPLRPLPDNRRIFFAPRIESKGAVEMLAAVSAALESQYGLNLILGAEQEYTIGPIAPLRTIRADRQVFVITTYNDLIWPWHKNSTFDTAEFFRSARRGDAIVQFTLHPDVQTDAATIHKKSEELLDDKRVELATIFKYKEAEVQKLKEKQEPLSPEEAKAHLEDWLNEMQLMAEAVTQRQRFGDEMVALRTLQESLSEKPDLTNIDTHAMLREKLSKADANLSLFMQSLVIDLKETIKEPDPYMVYGNQSEEVAFLKSALPEFRMLALQAFTSQNQYLYQEIKEKYVMDGDGLIQLKRAHSGGTTLTDEDIDRMACRLVQLKMQDQAAVMATLDHHASVVRRQRIVSENGLSTLRNLIFDKDMNAAAIRKALNEFEPTHLYNDAMPGALSEYYYGQAQQLKDAFNLEIDIPTTGDEKRSPKAIRDHMRELMREVVLKTDFGDVNQARLADSVNALYAYYTRYSKALEYEMKDGRPIPINYAATKNHWKNWTPTAIAQREQAFRQTDVRALPEFADSLRALKEVLDNAPDSKAAWKAVDDAIDRNRIRRTYHVGSKLDADESVLSDGHLKRLADTGTPIPGGDKDAILNTCPLIADLRHAGVDLDDNTKKLLSRYITYSSYISSDLMMLKLREEVESIYKNQILPIIRAADSKYAEGLPKDAVMDMHVEGGGAEFAREAVTTPLPVEINRVISRIMSGFLRGDLDKTLPFTDHTGKKHDLQIRDPRVIVDNYPELFINAYARGTQMPVGQHVHYSAVAKSPEGQWETVPGKTDADDRKWKYRPYEVVEKGADGADVTKPSDFAFYSHLAILKLGPQFRAAMGVTSGSLDRWLNGLASPDHFRALMVPPGTPNAHQLTRGGAAIKPFDDHGELRAGSTDADTRFLFAYLALAQQHAADNYVIDKLYAFNGQQAVTAENLEKVVAEYAKDESDIVMQQFLRQEPDARAAWLERVKRHLEQGVIVCGDFAKQVALAKTPKDNGTINFSYDPEGREDPQAIKGQPIVEEKEASAFGRGRSDTVFNKWMKNLAMGLGSHLPPDLAKEISREVRTGYSIT